jgi:FimV-like protein
MWRRASTILCLLFVSTTFADPAPTTQPAKTGAFDITFTQRSPDTEYSKLIERIGLPKEKLGADYDISQESLTAYVPANYDPQKPIGLIMQIWQDGSPEIYQGYRPTLDKLYFMMIATKRDHRSELNGVGICLDAIYNVRKIYNVDPARIYFFGLGQTEEPIGWSTGDVVMGDLYCWWVGYNKPLWAGDQPLFEVNPPPRLMNLVKSHMQILGFAAQDTTPGHESGWKSIANRMENDGFNYVKIEPVDHDMISNPDWFKARIEQLELVKSQPPGAAAAGVQPTAPDEPARLLHLAQAYIASGLTDKAKEKLNELIEKYPSDPAAAKAKDLLAQLSNQ